MLARNALLFKWSVYVGTMLLAILIQTALLNHLVIGGIFPYLYPVVVAVMATYEKPTESAVYGLIFGVLCDTAVLQHTSFLYTILFPLVAILSTCIAKNLLKSGFLCSGVTTVLAFFLHGLFQCISLSARGQNPWVLGFAITGQELALSFLCIIPLTLAFSFIAERTRDD
ncbi:hypothetical protein RFF05_10780 [Bengtsoniella intestinalis]|uniref:hypothetical protein n=1 Tax=Bengtsoniella intestinalis TaxID=3073143 RepID=UPI00391F4CD0